MDSLFGPSIWWATMPATNDFFWREIPSYFTALEIPGSILKASPIVSHRLNENRWLPAPSRSLCCGTLPRDPRAKALQLSSRFLPRFVFKAVPVVLGVDDAH